MREGLGRAGLLLAALALSLAAAEVLLRVFAPIPYSMRVEYEPDAHVGQRLADGRVYRLADGGRVVINRAGYRGPEIEVEKPPGTLRLVALGGSSTFCYQTDEAAIWTRRLEDRLREAFGGRIEVVNAGTPGYCVFDSKLNHLYRIRKLSPDVVIVYHTWNDLKLFRTLERKGMPERSPYRGRDPLRSTLRRLQLAWRVRSLFQQGPLPPRAETVVPEGKGEGPTHIPSGGRAHRWERQNFDDLGLLLESDGALPVFASQAGLLSEENVDEPAIRERVYAEYVGLDYDEILRQWLAVREIIRDAARRHDAVFADVYDAVPHDLDHFHDHVHLTPRGNEAVARALFETLRDDPRFRARVRGSRP